MLIVGISFVLCVFCLLLVVFVWLIVVFLFFSLLLYLKCWNCNMIYNLRKPPYHNQNLFPAKLFNRSTLVNERKQNSYNFSFRSFLVKFKNDLFGTNINYPYRFLNIWNTIFKLELKVVTLKKDKKLFSILAFWGVDNKSPHLYFCAMFNRFAIIVENLYSNRF